MAGEIYRKPIMFAVVSAVVILIGTIVTMFAPMMMTHMHPKLDSLKPFTALELAGRDIYQREGCNNCHTQTVRPLKTEVMRYGEYSKSGEFIYDRPFLWGSKRTGPDLHREGGKYPDSWHYNHMYDPTSMSPGSLMPPYPWLIEDDMNTSLIPGKIKVLRKLGTPYEEGYEEIAVEDLQKQAIKIAESLRKDGIDDDGLENKEIIALIAYLQRLGTDIKPKAQAGK